MLVSNYESLQDIQSRKVYTPLQEKRIETLENTVKELREYFTRCPKCKKSTIQRMIERYNNLLDRLNKTHEKLSVS